jgi:hypothetical protein
MALFDQQAAQEDEHWHFPSYLSATLNKGCLGLSPMGHGRTKASHPHQKFAEILYQNLPTSLQHDLDLQ